MPLTGKEMLKLARKHGWELIRVNGSHHVVEKDGRSVSIPIHNNDDLKKGMEAKLKKDLGL